ncbi:MAG: BMP family ABC transporter substrate-binding protein [Bacillota bacterium]|nr:BMP family ABC transporter substrate-binding protein [Bacillota bacterium]
MKKFLVMLVVLSLVMAAFVGCAKKEEPVAVEEPTPAEEEAPAEEPVAEEVAFTVGLVTDVGGIDDKSFNQGTWEGIVRFAEDTGVETNYLQSASDADYIPNLSTFSDEELDVIIAPGFLFADAMTEVSANFPDQKYLIIDMVVGDRSNVASAVFAEHEGSFLTGVAAALKAEEAGENTVGFIGGMDFDLIQKFEAGFEAGVATVNPDMKVLIEYAGSFSDTQIGQTLAAKMYDQGAYIIYHAAGGTGNGLIKEAKDRRTNGEDVWAIGVDKDQYADGIYEEGKSAVLTSMMKRVDVAAYDVSEKTLAGEFPGGEILVYSLSNDGVGIPVENPNLSDAIVSTVDEYKTKVISGEIEVPVLPNRLK